MKVISLIIHCQVKLFFLMEKKKRRDLEIFLFVVSQWLCDRWRKTNLFPTCLSNSWPVGPLFSQSVAESWLLNGHSSTWAAHLKFKISNVIIFTGPLIEGKLHSADECACCKMGHGSRWPSKKQKITWELVALSPGFLSWTLLPESLNAQIRSGKFGVTG